MSKPLLSIGMIVKDEIRCIEKCLKALQPLREAFPCELVIADTGSDDGTREVAERYADILFDFEWIDDFAAARNAVMNRCSGVWFFSVDSDEYLDSDLSGFQKLFSVRPKDWPELCGITIRNYKGRDLERSDYSDFAAVRMARMGKGAHYEGAIHEALQLTDADKAQVVIIPEIILHHDGYAYQSVEEKKKKNERNLALLDKCLSESPEDVRRLIQCIESSTTYPTRLLQYALQGMNVLRKESRKPEFLDGTLAARCVSVAASSDLPQTEEWLDWCMKQYPDVMAVRVDAASAAAIWYYKKGEYEKVLPLAKMYLDAISDERNGKVPPKERIFTVLQFAASSDRDKIRLLMSKSLYKLERKEEALCYLHNWNLEKVSANTANDWLRALAPLEDLPGAAEEMARALPLLEPEGEDQRRKDRWRGILPLLRQFFKPGWGVSEGAERPWRLLLDCDGPLGQGARVMACGGASEAEYLLSQVEDWETFPPEALLHALMLGVCLPADLCAQRPDLRLGLITAMAQGDPEFARHMAAYPWQTPDILPLLQTQFDLVTCAVQRVAPLKETGEAELCRRLCGKLAELSKELLPRLYNPELLSNPADWVVLPGNHQFCLWLLEGERKRAAGDIPGYLRDLRQGLEQAPGMKDLAEFLLKETEREAARAAATPELLALAEQVRGILEKFPPNDPAVAELKASPAYQRVAPLIEGVDAPVFGGLAQ